MKPSVWLSGQVMLRLAIISVLAFGALSCRKPPPRGSTGGRMDVYRSTAADVVSHKASAPELWVYSDQVAESLARDLADIDHIHSAPTRATLELGDLHNRTRTPTSDFEAIQYRIRGKLMKSRIIRDHFMIVEDPNRMDREKFRVAGEGNTGTARYAPDITYLLIGDFFESRRGSTRRYYFEFKLTNLASREIVFHKDYDLAQR